MSANPIAAHRALILTVALVVAAVMTLSAAGCSRIAPLARRSGVPGAAVYPREARNLPAVEFRDLPREAKETIRLIDQGGPFPYEEDGQTFENREALLPDRPSGYYREYTVETPGSDDRGARRIVTGDRGELYYTEDHYDSFQRVVR